MHNIGHRREHVDIMTLGELRDVQADMFMTVFIGNSKTRVIGEADSLRRAVMLRTAGQQGAKIRQQIQSTEPVILSLYFGGTTEGRVLAEAAARGGAHVVLSVATDYGEEVLEDIQDMEGIDIHKGAFRYR